MRGIGKRGISIFFYSNQKEGAEHEQIEAKIDRMVK